MRRTLFALTSSKFSKIHKQFTTTEMHFKTLLTMASVAIIAMASSCSSSKEISYFQDLKDGQQTPIAMVSPIRFMPHDKLSIIVSTGDTRLNTLFNLPVGRINVGTTPSTASTGVVEAQGSESVAPYTIDSKGDIDFPILGKLHIEGMTREEVSEYIRRELISRDLVKNPIVTVEYLNLAVTVMGEVSNPGRYKIDREDYSILDALSAAGDLTIFGIRDNVRVLREENGMQKVYEVNLNNGKSLAQSPVYYMQQNDVIYVEPNKTKARQSTPNGNNVLTPTFWISIASFIASIAVLIIK